MRTRVRVRIRIHKQVPEICERLALLRDSLIGNVIKEPKKPTVDYLDRVLSVMWKLKCTGSTPTVQVEFPHSR